MTTHRRSQADLSPRPARAVGALLPVLDAPPPAAIAARPGAQPEEALQEYATDGRLLPAFHVWTLGCQMNASDSEEMAGALLAAGCSEAPTLEEARLIVINSCSIREAAEQKVIGRMGLLAGLKAADPSLRVVLTGCSVRADNEAILARRYPAVDLFLRPDEEAELVARLGLAGPTTPGELSGPEFQRVGRSVAAVADRLPSLRAAAVETGRIARLGGTRAWLPIVYGCDKTCTYCIVPFARGPERSRAFDDVVSEAARLAAAGYRQVTLLGQNVNSWGHDLPSDPRFRDVAGQRQLGRAQDRDGRPDIAALLRAIDAIRDESGRPRIDRLRFVTSHPWDLTERLIAAMADCPSVCEHLHLPVQSGSDEILHRMGRQYDVAAYLDLVARLRAALPGISLTTDVIVGFCGETEAQFEATLDLLRAVRFDQVFAAAYSPRPGTPAARLPDDVPAAEKRRRLNVLLALQEDIGRELNEAWLGRRTEVLVEEARRPRPHDHGHGASDEVSHSPERGPRLVGRNREHKLVHFDGPASLVGQLVDVEVTRVGPYALAGRAVGEDGHA
jgi:tRNA-2-methylthio-N6-dimethylallyladenosine synthase